MKDKQRDLIKMILPSKAANFARFKSREIHRQERHAINAALHQHPPDEEWEDGPYYRNVNSAESYSRHEMPYRVRERRSADNLSGLQRWVEHQQRKAKGDDRKAYEKCVEVIQPGKNLICKHAMEHAAVWLDVPEGRRFYLPEMNARDIAAQEAAIRHRLSQNYGPIIISEDELKTLLNRLYATQHGKLNKILKKYNLMLQRCTKDDPCTTETHRKVTQYFIFDRTSWLKWRQVPRWEWDAAIKAGQKTQIRDVLETISNHDIQKCQNRVIISGPADVEILFYRLRSTGFRMNGSYSPEVNAVFKDILKLAEQMGLR